MYTYHPDYGLMFVISIIAFVITMAVAYLVIKAAVRNGINESAIGKDAKQKQDELEAAKPFADQKPAAQQDVKPSSEDMNKPQ